MQQEILDDYEDSQITWDGRERPTWQECRYCRSIAKHTYRTGENLVTGQVVEKHTCMVCWRVWWKLVPAEG